jgi:hypothetical protein
MTAETHVREAAERERNGHHPKTAHSVMFVHDFESYLINWLEAI